MTLSRDDLERMSVIGPDGTLQGFGINRLAHQCLAQMDEIAALRKQVAEKDEALGRIANGEGYYGAQAREYKEVARAALDASRVVSHEVPSVEPKGRIWIWFADNGNIRKWSSEPFNQGIEYARAARGKE